LIPLSKFRCKKETWGYAKVIHKKEKKKEKKKRTSVRDIKNNGYSDAPDLSQKYFQVSRERYVFKEHSRIRLSTTHISTSYIHTHAHLDLII
jgi:hypothetical protein